MSSWVKLSNQIILSDWKCVRKTGPLKIRVDRGALPYSPVPNVNTSIEWSSWQVILLLPANSNWGKRTWTGLVRNKTFVHYIPKSQVLQQFHEAVICLQVEWTTDLVRYNTCQYKMNHAANSSQLLNYSLAISIDSRSCLVWEFT